MKNGFYFPHDYNARNDKKLNRVLMELELCGVGLYWCLIEMLYEENGYLKLSDCNSIAFALHTDEETVLKLVKKYGLFSFNRSKFWSESVLERITLRQEKSKKAQESALSRWYPKKRRGANALPTDSDSNANKEKKSKVDKNKEFYENELISSNNNSKYSYLIDFLFGKNPTGNELTPLLEIRDQISFENFKKLYEKSEKKEIKLSETILTLYNTPKYYKDKKSLYLTLNTWLNR